MCEWLRIIAHKRVNNSRIISKLALMVPEYYPYWHQWPHNSLSLFLMLASTIFAAKIILLFISQYNNSIISKFTWSANFTIFHFIFMASRSLFGLLYFILNKGIENKIKCIQSNQWHVCYSLVKSLGNGPICGQKVLPLPSIPVPWFAR